MLINASLTRPCVQKLQMLAHGRISSKLKAAVLSPFAGIALPFGDACLHSTLAVVKIPFLVAPFSIGRLAGKGFVSSLDHRSPRKALLSQMAFHVVRGLASLTLLAVSTLAIPTIPFLVVMPRIVTKTHDKLGLNRLFKTRIAPKPSPVKHVAILKAAAPIAIKQAPQVQTVPIVFVTKTIEPAPSSLPKPFVAAQPLIAVQPRPLIAPPQQQPMAKIPVTAPSQNEQLPTHVPQNLSATLPQVQLKQAQAAAVKPKKRVGLPPETESSSNASRSEMQLQADWIARQFKNVRVPKPSDPPPIPQVAAPAQTVPTPAIRSAVEKQQPRTGSQIINAILTTPPADPPKEIDQLMQGLNETADTLQKIADDVLAVVSTGAPQPDISDQPLLLHRRKGPRPAASAANIASQTSSSGEPLDKQVSQATHQHQVNNLFSQFANVKKPQAELAAATASVSDPLDEQVSQATHQHQVNNLVSQFARAKKTKTQVKPAAASASSSEVTPQLSPQRSATAPQSPHQLDQHRVNNLVGQFARAKKPKTQVKPAAASASSSEVTPQLSPRRSTTAPESPQPTDQHRVDNLVGQFARAKKPKPAAKEAVLAESSLQLQASSDPSTAEEAQKTGNKVEKLFGKALKKQRYVDENAAVAGNIPQT